MADLQNAGKLALDVQQGQQLADREGPWTVPFTGWIPARMSEGGGGAEPCVPKQTLQMQLSAISPHS